MVGDPGIEPGVSHLEGVTVPCHTLRPDAQHWRWIPVCSGPVKRKKAMICTCIELRQSALSVRRLLCINNGIKAYEKTKVGD